MSNFILVANFGLHWCHWIYVLCSRISCLTYLGGTRFHYGYAWREGDVLLLPCMGTVNSRYSQYSTLRVLNSQPLSKWVQNKRTFRKLLFSCWLRRVDCTMTMVYGTVPPSLYIISKIVPCVPPGVLITFCGMMAQAKPILHLERESSFCFWRRKWRIKPIVSLSSLILFLHIGIEAPVTYSLYFRPQVQQVSLEIRTAQ